MNSVSYHMKTTGLLFSVTTEHVASFYHDDLSTKCRISYLITEEFFVAVYFQTHTFIDAHVTIYLFYLISEGFHPEFLQLSISRNAPLRETFAFFPVRPPTYSVDLIILT